MSISISDGRCGRADPRGYINELDIFESRLMSRLNPVLVPGKAFTRLYPNT